MKSLNWFLVKAVKHSSIVGIAEANRLAQQKPHVVTIEPEMVFSVEKVNRKETTRPSYISKCVWNLF